jgi:hypothetical protein
MKKKTSPLKIKSPKMRKSLNSSSERMFIRGSSINVQKKSPRKLTVKSPKIKSPKMKSPTTIKKMKSPTTIKKVKSPTNNKKKVSFGNSLNKLEEKVKSLYGPNDIFNLPQSEGFIPSQPISHFQEKPKIQTVKSVAPKIKSQPITKSCNSKCNILANQCYIDCINYITTNISEYEKNPNDLVDDLFVMIEPRMNKDVYIQNINTANLYNNMVEYTAKKWTDEDIKTIKTLVKSVKDDNIHYKPVKMFLKEVKFYKYYT